MPDITVLGKIIGGGLPMGAYGGRKEIMSKIAPEGPVYQAGTLSGNPIATAAGIAILKTIKSISDFYNRLDRMGKLLEDAYLEIAKPYNINISINRIGSLVSVFFNDSRVVDYKTAVQSNLNTFRRYFSSMLERGIYLAPSQFEAMFISYAHNEKDIEMTKNAIEETFV
jgi:glutamate-1-semialdehyde 2,1-aminomutase